MMAEIGREAGWDTDEGPDLRSAEFLCQDQERGAG